MSSGHTKLVANEYYSQGWSKIPYFRFEVHSVLGKRRQTVNVNATVPSTETRTDYFRALWKPETHNTDLQTIPVSCNYFCSWSPILEQTTVFSLHLNFNHYCLHDWLSTSTESLTTLDQSAVRNLRSRFVTSLPSSSACSQEQVDNLRTCTPKNELRCL